MEKDQPYLDYFKKYIFSVKKSENISSNKVYSHVYHIVSTSLYSQKYETELFYITQKSERLLLTYIFLYIKE